jgi:cytosine/adenosine deaminase-related metal-dependent hydrolase
VRDVLEFATLAGARAAGLDGRTGSLSPGKQADLILIRATDINLAPVTDPAAAVVLAAHPGNVDTVLVAGRALKRGGRLLAADLPGVLAQAEASRRRVLATIAARRGA